MAPVKIKNEGFRQMVTGKVAIRTLLGAWAFGRVENLACWRYIVSKLIFP
jgi:hypothetical protein